MKQFNPNTKCYTCYGCNKLEIELFDGVRYCPNYIKAQTEADRRVQKHIQKCKDILNKKEMKGEQMKL